MHIILTHEQADLDALASLLGARLLYPQAIALLPRQLNRNALAFLQEYGPDLPLTLYKDLPNEPIQEITLVDTQSMVTLRGLNNNTKISIIDHHPRKTQNKHNWNAEIINTGACTSILVDKLRQNNADLDAIHATLMLLGIYEDTGSLGYGSTTPQDVYACAWLLEQGANLGIVSTYLNPPLSHAQLHLYDRLLKDLSTVQIENKTIVIAKALALDLNDEISSVSHQLRDFLAPDGLILLVLTRQGVRLVARSTTDEINMAQLAQHFGGGGHKRAASALIRNDAGFKEDLNSSVMDGIYRELLHFLPSVVLPGEQVEQIMSLNPMTFSPETSVHEAQEVIKRYGFEGYPVLQEGQLIGLLTSRNIERALQLKLDVRVGDLMDSGNVSVTPQTGIAQLREVMAISGWGQIPVLDPQGGAVIGIVTRTDLLKTLISHPDLPRQEKIISLLENSLPPARLQLLKAVAQLANHEELAAYIVGGFVRDLLLGRNGQDFDIVLEGDAIHFAEDLSQRYGGRVISHRQFGTAKWLIGKQRAEIASRLGLAPQGELDLPEHLDLISARTEFYEKPAALPSVERASIKMDLHRRDFTINTLALRLDGRHYGKILDYWGGYDDLKKGQIRVLHALSFVDDATRILRAIRFAIRFNFEIEGRTMELLKAGLPLLQALSGIRLQHEINLIMDENKVVKMLQCLSELGILAGIHADLPWNAKIGKQIDASLAQLPKLPVARLDEKNRAVSSRQNLLYCLWLQSLPTTKLASVSERLCFSNHLQESIREYALLSSQIQQMHHASPSDCTAWLDGFSTQSIENALLALQAGPEKKLLESYRNEWQHIHPYTRGDELRAMGLPPTEQYRQILWRLRVAWLDGEISSPNEEQKLLQKLLSDGL